MLVGELAEGSWPTVMIGDTPLRPIAPLHGPRRTPWSVERADRLPLECRRRQQPTIRTSDPGRSIRLRSYRTALDRADGAGRVVDIGRRWPAYCWRR